MNDDGKKKVEVFDLNLSSDVANYEELLNNPNVEIYDEKFAYTNKGEPKITVWYIIDE